MGATMILPDFVLPNRVDQTWSHSGIDSFESCLDKKHFKSYPHDVTYNYNSRGFRDSEWPNSIAELKKSIWCVGDSFTVGLGSPLAHTWPYLLQQDTGARTINVSMDGASNDWMARKCQRILTEIQPECLIIQWSYISRREKDVLAKSWLEFYNVIRDRDWPACSWQHRDQLPQHIQQEIETLHGGWQPPDYSDEDLREWASHATLEQDVENLLQAVDLVHKSNQSTCIVHSFIPGFGLGLPNGYIESKIQGCVVPEIQKLDHARDSHHYDIKTSQAFVQQLTQILEL